MADEPERYLMYFADPMCSWCWGFSPAIDHIQKDFGDDLPVRLVMGGLRPGNVSTMSEDDKRQKRHHWEQVHAASGQPFNFDFFEREGFVDNTEPACRAVVAARTLEKAKAIPMMKAVQHAYYIENRDVTDGDELCRIAAEVGFDEDAFRKTFEDTDTMDETRRDFWLAQNTGVSGFPTLIAVDGGQAQAVTIGFSPAENIVPALAQWLGREQAAD